MKNSLIYLLLFLTTLNVSCSNEDFDVNDVDVRVKKLSELVEVVNMVDPLINMSRGFSSDIEEKQLILKFKNTSTYNQVLERFKEIDQDERCLFFNEIGFDGVYMKLYEAECKLDKIFDIEDDNEFVSAYNDFKLEYSSYFNFNEKDKYDLSPYARFTDEDMELLGNKNGYIMIGDHIIYPEKDNTTYVDYENEVDYEEVSPGFYVKKGKTPQSRAFGPSIVDAEFKGFKGASAMIKQGKYQSTISIGYTNNINNNPITVRYASQKKKKLWKRRHETTYSATIEFNNNYFNAIVPLKHSKAFVNLGAPLKVLGVNATVHVRDFTSGCCDKVKHSYL